MSVHSAHLCGSCHAAGESRFEAFALFDGAIRGGGGDSIQLQ